MWGLTATTAALSLFTVISRCAALDVVRHELLKRHVTRTEGGVHLPLIRSETLTPGVEKRGAASAVGLGNYVDV